MAGKKFSELAPAQQGAVLAILPVVLAVVAFYDLVSPLRTRAAELKNQVDTIHQQNQRGRLLESQHAALESKISQAQAELAQLREIVPDEPADDQFVKTIYALAQTSGTHIRSLQAEAESREMYYTAMPFKVHMDGAYYGLLNFFSSLANSQRIVNVSGLSLRSIRSSGGGSYRLGPQETVGADCVLTTFYNSPPPVSKKPGVRARR